MNITPSALANTVLLGCLALSGHAMAGCTTGTAINQTMLATVVSGNTVCAARTPDRWQEYHRVGGDLIDYKLGPANTIDPSEKVGTWSITGTGSNATVVYNYGAGGTYSYSVRSNGGLSYSFCGVENFEVTVQLGQVACP